MPRVTRHSKERLVQRNETIDNYAVAKRVAKIAWHSGRTIGEYNAYPKFFSYLTNKRNQSNTCSIRIYQDNIFIWRGSHRNLVTSHPIPDRYKEEMELVDKQKEVKENDNNGES